MAMLRERPPIFVTLASTRQVQGEDLAPRLGPQLGQQLDQWLGWHMDVVAKEVTQAACRAR